MLIYVYVVRKCIYVCVYLYLSNWLKIEHLKQVIKVYSNINMYKTPTHALYVQHYIIENFFTAN